MLGDQSDVVAGEKEGGVALGNQLRRHTVA